jgi:hypothetical protein
MRTYLYTHHACGHQVWWSDSDLAERLAASDCPWCGGEAKQDFPPLNIALKIEQPQQEKRDPVNFRAQLTCIRHAPYDVVIRLLDASENGIYQSGISSSITGNEIDWSLFKKKTEEIVSTHYFN